MEPTFRFCNLVQHQNAHNAVAACSGDGEFIFSQAQDWNNGGASCDGKWDKAQEHDMDDYIDTVAVPQMRELLSNYGESPPCFGGIRLAA